MNDKTDNKTANKTGSDTSTIWGGRFAAGPSAVMDAINASIDFDQRFYTQDIAGSKAHARMLADQGILTVADVDAITVSMSRGASAPAADVAAVAILIAVAVNTAAKAAIGWTAGGRRAGLSLAAMTVAAVAAGVCGEAVWLSVVPAG